MFVHFSICILDFDRNTKIILEQINQDCSARKRDSQHGPNQTVLPEATRAPDRPLRQGLGCSWPPTPWTGSSPLQMAPASQAAQEEHPPLPTPRACPGRAGSHISVSPSPRHILLSSSSGEQFCPDTEAVKCRPKTSPLSVIHFTSPRIPRVQESKGSRKAFLESGIHRACLPAHNSI